MKSITKVMLERVNKTKPQFSHKYVVFPIITTALFPIKITSFSPAKTSPHHPPLSTPCAPWQDHTFPLINIFFPFLDRNWIASYILIY
jgi:hypothetical protein